MPQRRAYAVRPADAAYYATPSAYSHAVREAAACPSTERRHIFPLARLQSPSTLPKLSPAQTLGLVVQSACTPYAHGTGLALHAMATHLQHWRPPAQHTPSWGGDEAALALMARTQRLISSAAGYQDVLIAHTAMHPGLMGLPEGPLVHRQFLALFAESIVERLLDDHEVLVPLSAICYGPGAYPEPLAGHLALAYLCINALRPTHTDVHFFDASGFDGQSYDTQMLVHRCNQRRTKAHPALFCPNDIRDLARPACTSPASDRIFTHAQHRGALPHTTKPKTAQGLLPLLSALFDEVTYVHTPKASVQYEHPAIKSQRTEFANVRLGKGPYLYHAMAPWLMPAQRLLPKQQGGECEHACLLPFLLFMCGPHRTALAQHAVKGFYQATLQRGERLLDAAAYDHNVAQMLSAMNEAGIRHARTLEVSLTQLRQRIDVSPLALACR